MRFTGLILLAFLFLSACQNAEKKETADTETMVEETATVEEKQYTLTPFTPSTAYEEATMNGMTYKNGTFNFDFSNYELQAQTPDAASKMCANSEQGQHIHLIVNTQPYAAKYDAKFPYELEDGEQYLLAFLSRSYHESIKNGKAYIGQKVTVSNKSITNAEDITTPTLFYSRPKGTYVGEANTKKVMLDFYLLNANLGSDYLVKAQINDEEYMIDTWQPYYIEGLPMGDNIITLTLVDKDGNKVDTPLNPVSRKFTLKADPAEELN